MEKSKRTVAALVTEAVTAKGSSSSKQKEILVPIDFSESSLSALRHARELAVEQSARVILLNVVEEQASFRTLDAVGQYRVRCEQRSGRLQEIAERELGSRVVTRIEVREGKPSVEIARFASQRQVDLIIVGRHQHHGLRQWFHGHTASKLSKNAPCPLVVLQAGHHN
jgi:nucleotide-binding universal stress UspA family protein